MAATLFASLCGGCGTDVRAASAASSADPEAPDASVARGDGTLASHDATSTVTADAGMSRCGDSLCIDLADDANAALRSVDGARVLTLSGERLIVIRTAADQFVVLSAVCTHAGCTVRYAPARSDVECPCHGSTFALDGSVTQGPANTPLARYTATYDATMDVVYVTLS